MMGEFEPLPYFPWETRPPSLPIDIDEAAALHLAHGNVDAAASLLKVTRARLNKLVRAIPRLQRLCAR